MIPTQAEERPVSSWTRRQWVTRVVLLLVVQVLLIFMLNRESDPVGRPSHPAIKIRLSAEHSGGMDAEVRAADPTLFALAHPHGFSRHLWNPAPRLEYELKGWDEPPRWMEPDLRRLGARFHQFVVDRFSDPVPFSRRPEAEVLDLSRDRGAMEIRPAVSMEGGLVGRRLLSALPPADLRLDSVISNSVLHLSVTASGEVLSAVLLSGSGSDVADRQAVQWAMQARFAPLDKAGSSGMELSFGRVVFDWLAFASKR